MKTHTLSATSLLLGVLVLTVGCASPNLAPPSPATVTLGAQETRLVFRWESSRAAFNPGAAGYLTLRLQAKDTHETRFGSAVKDGAGNYTVSLNALMGGHWDARVFLYDSANSATLLYYANQDIYLRPGAVNTPTLALYSPGSIDGVGVTAAVLPASISFHVAEDTTSFDPDLGLPSAGQSLLLDAEVHGDTDFATDQGVVWSSSDEAVATVDDGRVQTHRPGSVVITAQSRVLSRVAADYHLTVLSSLVGTWENFDLTSQDSVVRITTLDGENLNLLITRDPMSTSFRGGLQLVGPQAFWSATEAASSPNQAVANPWTPAGSSPPTAAVTQVSQDTLTFDSTALGNLTLHRVKTYHAAAPVGVNPSSVSDLTPGDLSPALTLTFDPLSTHADVYFVSSDPSVAMVVVDAGGEAHIRAYNVGTASIYVRNVWDRSAPQGVIAVTVTSGTGD